jgi:uncharacterized membrane protein YagU involved in acid resistance
MAAGMWAEGVRGGLAGFGATWLMDVVTTGLYAGQAEATTEREEAARPNGKSAVENLVDRIEARSGRTFTDAQRSAVTQAIHFGLGVGPGAAYAVLRRRMPLVGASRGLLYGALLWAVNDEYLNTALGLAGPFGGYPLETHWRGLVGHIVLGMATDSGIDVLGGERPARRLALENASDLGHD